MGVVVETVASHDVFVADHPLLSIFLIADPLDALLTLPWHLKFVCFLKNKLLIK
jgi:hypothetical protein